MSLAIKICGLSTPETLEAALGAGADMVGFVFFPPSPRHVSVAQAEALGRQADGRAAKVALSVDADDATLDEAVRALAPQWLQLHGHESPQRIAGLKARFGLPVIKAIGISNRADLDRVGDYVAVADQILFDARPPKDATRPGGLGRAFDWTLLAGLALPVPFMLSGGLSAGNVAEALRLTRAPGIDVSSGVERAPGVKDPDLIRDFIRAARAAVEPQLT